MAKKQSKLETKLNAFSRVTFLDENGRPKSSAWLYSFLLGLLFATIYAAVFIGSGILLARVFPNASFAILLLQYLMTALVGSIPGLLFSLFLKEDRKALPYYAYIWIGVLVLLVYGSVLWGVLPGQEGISWQGHLFGAVGGVLAAWILASDVRRARRTGDSATLAPR